MAATEPIRNREDIGKLLRYLLENGNLRNHLLIAMGVYTALRVGDMLALKWGDVFLPDTNKLRSHIYLKEKKTNKSKAIAINMHISRALMRYASSLPDISEDTYIFRADYTKNKPLCRSQAYRIILNSAAAAGLEGRVSCHSLRKTFGYHAWRSGIPSAVIMDIYNHSSFDVTRRYLGVCQEDKDKVYLNMNFLNDK